MRITFATLMAFTQRFNQMLACASGIACLSLFGCATYPTPYSKAHLAKDVERDGARALAHYIQQPSADASQCTRHAAFVDAEGLPALFSAETFKNATPRTLRHCVVALRDAGVPVEDALERRYIALALDKNVGPATFRRATRVLSMLERPHARAKALLPAVRALEASSAEKARLAVAFERIVEIQAGAVRGKPLTEKHIATLTDERVLRRISRHAPAPALRVAADTRFLSLRAAKSRYPSVRSAPARAIQNVQRWGQNRVSETQLQHATLAPTPGAAIRYLQHLVHHAVELTLITDGGSTLSDVIAIRVPGIGRPIGLCRAAEARSLDPCVPVDDVRLVSPLLHLDERAVRVKRVTTAAHERHLASLDSGAPVRVEFAGTSHRVQILSCTRSPSAQTSRGDTTGPT